jgi:hypothetical protein
MSYTKWKTNVIKFATNTKYREHEEIIKNNKDIAQYILKYPAIMAEYALQHNDLYIVEWIIEQGGWLLYQSSIESMKKYIKIEERKKRRNMNKEKYGNGDYSKIYKNHSLSESNKHCF